MKKVACEKKQERILYFDYLRILATLAVIVLHVAAQNWHSVDLRSFEWQIFNVTDSLVRWAVPVFIMISGAIFLDNDKRIETKKIYKHNIFTKLMAFIFWSCIYIIYRGIVGNDIYTFSFIEGNYHMWFLYMLMGLYIITPVVRKITESKKITEYFLIIIFIFSFLIPSVRNLLGCIDSVSTSSIVNSIEIIFSNIDFLSTTGYVFYYVLGFYLYKYDINIIFRRIGYILGIIGFLLTVFLTNWYSNKIGAANEIFYSNFSINVLLMALSIFIFAKYVLSRLKLNEKKRRILVNISNCSFGVYLVHALVIDIFNDFLNFNTLTFNPIISVIIVTLCVAIVSYIISFILNCVSLLKKYVV